MQLQFNAISELGAPGVKFQKLFQKFWPAYHAWLIANDSTHVPNLATSQAALEKYMPEMMPIYYKLCTLVHADEVAARFLTGYQPPAYTSACSQVVLAEREIQLIRNYDYHPLQLEGTLLLSSWNGKKVMAVSDCLVGVLDGINEDGLAVSLTFGGRKVVGEGFGIPVILRYVLEFCSNVEEAVEALIRVPSHMSFNVTVVDKTGAFKTVLLSPDREAVVTDINYTTNHQMEVDWPENAAFNNTIERSTYLYHELNQKELDEKTLIDSFLKKPLYNDLFSEGFGTLYTSIYRPKKGTMELRWLKGKMKQSFKNFKEGHKLIHYKESEVGLLDQGSVSGESDRVVKITPQKIVLSSDSSEAKKKKAKPKGGSGEHFKYHKDRQKNIGFSRN